MMNGGYGMMGGFGIWGLLLQLVVIIGVVYLIVMIVRGNVLKENDPHQNKNLQILEERYARGEISEEEFKHKRRVLLDRESNS